VFQHLGNPARVVGAVLEAQGFHPKRTARNHLRVYAAAMNVPDQRVDQVLQLVGLAGAAHRKAGGFSLGMRQRLALATALLGDPQVLVLDEPANGLDPEGIAWLRNFLQAFARSGRTVLVSSHLLSEIEQTVDQVVIVSRGQCVYFGSLDYLRRTQQSRVLVQAADPQALVAALREAELTAIEALPDGRLAIVGADTTQVADIALKAGIALHGVQEEQIDLERLFFQLTSGEFTASAPGSNPQQGGWGGGPGGPGQQGSWGGPPSGPLPQQAPQGYQQPAPQGYPPQGYQQPAPQGYPPQGYQQPAPQGYPPLGYQQPAPQDYPPQGYQQPTPQDYPPQGYPPQPQQQPYQQGGPSGFGGNA
jgi:ABC-2 type transport system ATP-binding protein